MNPQSIATLWGFFYYFAKNKNHAKNKHCATSIPFS